MVNFHFKRPEEIANAIKYRQVPASIGKPFQDTHIHTTDKETVDMGGNPLPTNPCAH